MKRSDNSKRRAPNPEHCFFVAMTRCHPRLRHLGKSHNLSRRHSNKTPASDLRRRKFRQGDQVWIVRDVDP